MQFKLGWHTLHASIFTHVYMHACIKDIACTYMIVSGLMYFPSLVAEMCHNVTIYRAPHTYKFLMRVKSCTASSDVQRGALAADTYFLGGQY